MDRELVLGVWLAYLLHEGAHLAALRLTGGHLRTLRLSLAGANILTQQGGGYGSEMITLLAGPGANLLCAFLLARLGERWYLWAGIQLVAGAFNLLPLPGLDGGRGVYLLLLLLTCWGEE